VTRLDIHKDQIFTSWRKSAAKMAKISQNENFDKMKFRQAIFTAAKISAAKNFHTKFRDENFRDKNLEKNAPKNAAILAFPGHFSPKNSSKMARK
jgi:uncharacterized protein YjbI with pentapeptide repeats